MSSQRRGGLRAARLTMVALFGVLATIAAPGVALAEQSQIKLALLPVGQPGSYFDLTMRPGETRSLSVTIANDGGGALAARTYAADVYTIINGGFGARLRDEPGIGTTTWLDYPADVLELAPGSRVARSFSVAVPEEAQPGEYITSLVLENDEPIAGSGGVAINQVIRQAVAVVVTVPGTRSPSLAVGRATLNVVAGMSVLRIAIANTGNIRLKPFADVTVLDEAGVQVGAAAVPLDTFYARTEAFLEMPLAAVLPPGAYSVQLAIGDATNGVPRRTTVLALVVDQPPAVAAGTSSNPGLGETIQGFGDGQISLPAPIVALIAILVLSSVVAVPIHVLVRRHRATTTA